MTLLQVYQAKALKQLYDGTSNPGLMQDLCTVMDLVLQATKVNLWLNLVDMRETNKHKVLNSPISQAGHFGDTFENFAQQFSAVKKQTEAIKQILPRQ